MRQKDPEQGFIPRGAAAQVTQPHKAGRNGNLLLYNLKDKKPDELYQWSWVEDTACFLVLETHQRREAKGILRLPRQESWGGCVAIGFVFSTQSTWGQDMQATLRTVLLFSLPGKTVKRTVLVCQQCSKNCLVGVGEDHTAECQAFQCSVLH